MRESKKYAVLPQTVELVGNKYQPSKAEIKEEFTLRKKDGSRANVEEIASAVLRPIKVRWIGKPRNGRAAK